MGVISSFRPAPRDAPRPVGRARLLRPGATCWRIERARRVAFLVDGEEYFAAVRAAIARAQRSVYILGWDIDSRMRLMPQGAGDGYPEELAPFLNAIVSERRKLRAYVLAWDFAMLYAFEREWLPIYHFDWKTHRRLHFRLDGRHPLGASHHQKIVVVDDEVALLGGFDLTRSRWDRSSHACDDALRADPNGAHYAPFHDVGAIVEGDCARALGDLARERWLRATGERLAPVSGRSDAWPTHVQATLANVEVGIARTEPRFGTSPGVDEVRRLHLEAIASARRFIFAENQYFTSRTIAHAFAQRLAEPDGPEIAILMPSVQSGWLEASTMGVLRARIHRMLREKDPRRRYRLYCPTLPGHGGGHRCLNVHSKVLAIDDEFLTLGSANLSERSMRLDTECNIALEARGDPQVAQAIAALRARLLGEHLDRPAEAIARDVARVGSLHRVIDAHAVDGQRTLTATEPLLDPTVDALTPDHGVLDPEQPLDPDVLVADLLPEAEPKHRVHGRLVALIVLVAALAGTALAWRYTPLREWLDFDTLVRFAEDWQTSPAAPLAVVAAYVAGGLLVVPVMLLIAVTAAVFGPALAILYALCGALASAAATYAIGRRLGRDTVRRLAGARVNALSQRLARRGVLAVLLVRLLPVAPYSIVNLVAGASHIGWRDFLLGTVLGLTPGIVMATVFVDRALEAIRHPGPVTYLVLCAIAGVIVTAGFAARRWLRPPEGVAPAAAPRDVQDVR